MLYGEVHNARACTHRNEDCFIASFENERGKFSCRAEDVAEFKTEKEAIDWLKKEARRRGEQLTMKRKR
jgi:hypothetical protein